MTRRPGCVVFLLQGSASLGRRAGAAARLHIDQAIDALLRRRGEAEALDIGVVGYHSHEKRIAFTSLLPDVTRSTDLVRLGDLQAGERRQLRLDRLPFEGKAPPAEGLAHAHLIVQRWLANHPDGRPPIVVHCGEATGYRNAHGRLSRSLRLMGPATGATGVTHHVLAPESELRFLGAPGRSLPREFRRLWKHSSPVLLESQDGPARSGRALSINSSPLPLVRGLLRQTRPLLLSGTSGRARMRVLTLSGNGRSEAETQDAVGCNASHGMVILSDGASEGIFAGEWSRLLTASYLTSRPNAADPVARASWLRECRQEWLRQIGFDTLRRPERERIERTGSGGTFLAWQLGTLPNGALAWSAWAIGDSCLLWIRENRLRASFPLAHSRHFLGAPALLSTWPQEPGPAPLFGAGLCKAGDLFVLASDAIARYLLGCVERGREPDWNRLEMMPEDDWRARLESLRKRERLVHDDCTLVLARVQR